MGTFDKAFFKTISYRRSLINVCLKFDAGNRRCTWARWIYLAIGSMMLIFELIVMRHEVRGFYLEVLKEVNTFFYIQKPPFGF